ncbi:hypothetical protein FAI40_00080 [Acetobacteraceae bacterium]|nr:hypothetical protein FAI40_00080 [Acetobacteraceae bacterium]
MKRLPVLILAGSRLGENDVLAKAGNVQHKALLPVAGTPMLKRVYQAILNADIASNIYIASENEAYFKDLNLEKAHYLSSRPTLPETIQEAIKKIGFPCLILTADHALLQPEWLQEFLNLSEKSSADVTFGIALKEKVEALSLKMSRTYIPLKDIQFSGCNLFFLRNESSENLIQLWQKIHHLRKSPAKMVKILGLKTLFKALFRRLDSITLLERVKMITSSTLEFIPLSNGMAAIDVDSIKDWELVESIYAKEK